MPVNRMLTCWCGFVQRECDRSATENAAGGGTVALRRARHVYWVMEQCWHRWLRTLAATWKKEKKIALFQTLLSWTRFNVCVGIYWHPLNASLPVFDAGEDTECSQVESGKAGGSQQGDCCIPFHTDLSSWQNKKEETKGGKSKPTGITWCHVLPRSFIRGNTFLVKLVYEAIVGSGEAMPTWASYILRFVGFFGRGWTCWRGNQS